MAKPLIKRVKGVWTVYAVSNPLNSMPTVLAYVFAQKLNGLTHYTPVIFIDV